MHRPSFHLCYHKQTVITVKSQKMPEVSESVYIAVKAAKNPQNALKLKFFGEQFIIQMEKEEGRAVVSKGAISLLNTAI